MAPPRPPLRALLACALALLAACSRGPVARSEGAAGVSPPTTSCPAQPPQDASPLIPSTADGCTDVAAVLSRCAPRLDPVLTLLGANGRRYLGGRFAVGVRALPSDAALLGRAGGLEIYREPGLEGRLFVVGDDRGVSRWLALPGPGRVAAPSLSVIGDSIALGSATPIVDALPRWATSIDAEIGRASDAGVPIAAGVRSVEPAPSAVVVELGTNDGNVATFVSSARSILRSLRGEPLVVWVSPHSPLPVTPEVRAEIARLVARTSNGVVADWDAAVPPDALSADGVHLLPDRVGVFADFVARDLRAWRMAVAGSGAASCAPSV